jgi:DNA topoisomerase I
MLLVIESPNKIKKIQSHINARVLATVGHFKDLPQDSMGVDLDNNYAPTFILDGKKDRIKQIVAAAAGQDVYIATDPDREGFAIGTHVLMKSGRWRRVVIAWRSTRSPKKGIDDAMKKSIPWANTNAGCTMPSWAAGSVTGLWASSSPRSPVQQTQGQVLRWPGAGAGGQALR